MTNPLPGPIIDNDLCANGREKTRHPIDPSSGEAQVTKQVVEKRPINSVDLVMSTLSKMHGMCRAWRSLAEDWTARKLSSIALLWMKVLLLGSTKRCMCCASLDDNSLANSLLKQCIRLISYASSFLRRRTI
jgi:hypothetical protein